MNEMPLTVFEFCNFLDNSIELPSGTVLELKKSDNDCPIYYGIAPSLWVDFINESPGSKTSMWYIYGEFANYIKALKGYGFLIERLEWLPKQEFIDQYPKLFQKDAEKLHKKMRKDLGEDIPSIEEPDIPSGINRVVAISNGSKGYTLRIPEAQHPGLWLRIISEGLDIHLKYHETEIRRCAAPDCNIYFFPTPRSHNQIYHSDSCRNRHYMREYRKSKDSL